MTRASKTLIITAALVHVAVLLVIVLLSIVFTPDDIESAFVPQWIFANSVINYLNYFIPITASAVAFAFAMVIRPDYFSRGKTFFSELQGVMVFLLILVAIYTAAFLVFLPGSYQSKMDASSTSEYIDTRIRQGLVYLEQGDYVKATLEAEAVIYLVPRHRDANALFQEARSRIPAVPASPEADVPSPELPLNMSYREVLDRAEAAFGNNDYVTAVFYSRLALGPEEDRDEPRAREILSLSIQAMDSVELDSLENGERTLFEMKRRAINAYNRSDYLTAYYVFRDAIRLDSADGDARLYLNLLEPLVDTISFFIDELEDASKGPSRSNTMVKLPDGSDGNMRFLAADQILRGDTHLYFINLELLELDENMRVITHVLVPKAKLQSGYLITLAADRIDASIRFEADYRVGRADEAVPSVITLDVDASDLWSVSSPAVFFNDINIVRLFNLAGIYEDYGLNPLFPQSEILYRILLPFSLVNISLLILAMSWKGRSRYLNGPPMLLYVLVPLIPIFILGMFELFVHLMRNLLSSILILSGFWVSLGALVGIQTVAFIIILLFISGLKTE